MLYNTKIFFYIPHKFEENAFIVHDFMCSLLNTNENSFKIQPKKIKKKTILHKGPFRKEGNGNFFRPLNGPNRV